MQFAHHDGSTLYVSDQTPNLGDTVTVKVRVRADAAVTAVHVRSVRDGEPHFSPATRLSVDGPDHWYAAELLIRNPVQNYRFLLEREDGYVWLNGVGVLDRDVSDTNDFRITVHQLAPQWARHGVLYQIFPDRFAKAASGKENAGEPIPEWAVPRDWDTPPHGKSPQTPYEYYGGTLDGIREHLDHIQDLGITGIYLTPVFPGRSNHRYDAWTFDEVDPLLGGNPALAELSTEVHRRGMKILGDLTTNHTGDGHEWFVKASQDPDSPEAEFYYWTDDELGYEAWLGVPSLPKLNYASEELWRRLISGPDSVVGKWLQPPYSLDGWRIDVANMSGRRGADDYTHDVARAVRQTAENLNEQALVIGEHFHDASKDVDGDGWHANMNYTGFTRPFWTWLVKTPTELDFLGVPTPVPSRPGKSVVATIKDFQAKIPWKVWQAQWHMLCSHDTARIATVVGSKQRVIVAATALLTMPGTPVIFAGDEFSGQGTNGEYSRTTMPWDREVPAGDDLRSEYRELIKLRRENQALLEGGLRWVLADDDAIGYLRETAEECVLVILTRSPWRGELDLGPAYAEAGGKAARVLFQHGGVEARPATGRQGTWEVQSRDAAATILKLR